MLSRLLGLFGRRPVVIEGVSKLPEGRARKIDVGDVLAGTGVQLLLCRVDGELHALDARCPHEGGRIAEGPLIEGRWAICPLHNYQFDPKTGAPRHAVCGKARTYAVREREGRAEIRL
jgi:nitrite reductase (NADH) small subunit